MMYAFSAVALAVAQQPGAANKVHFNVFLNNDEATSHPLDGCRFTGPDQQAVFMALEETGCGGCSPMPTSAALSGTPFDHKFYALELFPGNGSVAYFAGMCKSNTC